MSAIELARFTVRPEDAEALIAQRPAMIRALREQVPGFVELTSVRLDESTWLDIVEWVDRVSAGSAQELVMALPECAALFSLIQEVVAMEHGEVVERAGRRGSDAGDPAEDHHAPRVRTRGRPR